tara:strand:- start:22323 stop:23846 length:1524 start_codon:yes stop_codon:yes gene_type:complete
LNCSINDKIELINHYLLDKDFESLLASSEELLKYAPNNTEILGYKYEALLGLNLHLQDIGFLRKICWYSGICARYFDSLTEAYWLIKEKKNALCSLLFAISIEDTPSRRSMLKRLLDDIGVASVKLFFLSSDRIGHLTCEPDAWLRKYQHEGTCDNVLRIFMCAGKVCNDKLVTLLSRKLTILKSDFFHRFHLSRRSLLADEFYDNMPYDLASGDRLEQTIDSKINSLCSVYNHFPKVFYLEDKDFLEVQGELQTLGLSLNEPFVCLHVRDSAYLDTLYPELDVSYHRYRDASIKFYEEGIKYLLEQGYQVVRIGKETNQHLNRSLAGYFDLCGKITDGLELVLIDQCRFFWGTSSGPFGTAAMFDIPALLVNCVPAINCYSRNGRTINKPLKRNGQPVSFSSIIDGGTLSPDHFTKILECYNADELAKYGLCYEENSAQEILDALIEFVELVESGKSSFEKFGPLQQCFLSNIPECGSFRGRTIPTESFLRKYKQSYGGFVEEGNR